MRRLPPSGTVEIGAFSKTEPLSRIYGEDRGTPIDRYYIHRFLAGWQQEIRGRAVEIGETRYLSLFGGMRVIEALILDAPESGNPKADILADLASGVAVPANAFDSIVLTQTLHMVFDVPGVVGALYRALRPGCTCLATVPGISQIDAPGGPDKWF